MSVHGILICVFQFYIPFTNMFLDNWCLLVLSLLAIGTWLTFLTKRIRSYWPSRGVPGPVPLPFVGNMHQRIYVDLYHKETEWVQQYGKMYGTFMGPIPALMVADPELIKQILVKDFQHFINRGKPPALNKLLCMTLLFADNEQWRRIRSIISPTFTSGKLRAMQPQMSRSIDKLVTYLTRVVKNEDTDGVIDTKKVVSGLAIDVIASCGYATETNANDERDRENPFADMARALVDMNPLRIIGLIILPKFLLRWLQLDSFLPTEPFKYMKNLVMHIIKTRKESGKHDHSDLLQMMLDASVDEKELETINYDKLTATEDKDETIVSVSKPGFGRKQLTDEEITSNAVFFFLGGFETTSSTISHCLFELAHQPDLQERLYNEIQNAVQDGDSESQIETILSGIPLLEAVIKETLRLYPPISLMSRVCTTDGYKLGNVRLEKGTFIAIPVTAVQHSPEFFPEPYRFLPDRFMPENKDKLVPYSFIPFAAGPRNCVGMRFAYQEIRLSLAKIIQEFQISVTPETPSKLTFAKGNSLLVSTPFPLKVHKR